MIDISDVKVGDRVRVWRDADTDEAKFTVTQVLPRAALDSAANTFLVSEWDHMKRLKPPRKPLPTKPGLYIPYGDPSPDRQPVWRLRTDGTWLILPYRAMGVAYPVSPEIVDYYHRLGTLRYLETGQEQ